MKHFLRLLHLDDSPRRIALSFAVGAFVAFTPLLGVQMALAIGLAFVLRLNKRAALAGTFLNLPWLAPAYYVAAFALGGWIVGIEPSPYVLSTLKVCAWALIQALLDFNTALARAYWHVLVHQPMLQQTAMALIVGCGLLGTAIAASTYKVSAVVLHRHAGRAERRVAAGAD